MCVHVITVYSIITYIFILSLRLFSIVNTESRTQTALAFDFMFQHTQRPRYREAKVLVL